MGKVVYLDKKGRARFCEDDQYDPMPTPNAAWITLTNAKRNELTQFQDSKWKWVDGTPERVVPAVDPVESARLGKTAELEHWYGTYFTTFRSPSLGVLIGVTPAEQESIKSAAIDVLTKEDQDDPDVETIPWSLKEPPYLQELTFTESIALIREVKEYIKEGERTYGQKLLAIAGASTVEELNAITIE